MSAHRSNAAIGADIAKEADKPTPAQLVAEASVVVRLAATQWRPTYALARTIATIGDLQSAVTDLAAENARLREAMLAVVARLDQPVFNGTESAGHQAANILRADIRSALAVARAALAAPQQEKGQ